MSIIRSNIARQLLAEGGAPRKGFARGSGRGRTDADTMTGSGYTSSFDDGFGGGDEFARPTYSEQYAAMNVPDAVSKGGDNEPSFFQKAKNKFKTFETNARMNRVGRGVLTTPGAIKSVFGLRDVPPELLATLADDYTKGGLYSEGLVGGDISLENAASTLKGLEELGVDLTGDIRPQVANISRSKFAERFGPKTPKTEGGDSEPIIKRLKTPITEKIEEEPKGEFDDILQFYGARFADGGAIRQNYGLGSIVKKIGRTVKKVAKSPLGKAALFGAAAFGLPAIGSFGGTPGFLKSKFMKNLLLKEGKDRFTVGNLNPFSLLSIPTIASYFIAKKEEEEEELPTVSNTDPEFQKYLAFYGGPRRFAEAGGDIDKAPMKDIPRQEMASYGYNDAMSDTYDMFLQMKEKQLIPPGMDFQEFLQEVVPEMSKKEGVERTMAAGGGMMNPNDEMLNLGGNEMDLRGGGFVPLGEYEKKDDVPARLSKNEFVFTADAVKAAGGGSVDRGADIMYKTMKNLENKIA